MYFVDVHCHLDHPRFKDLPEVVARAEAAGVVAAIAQGVNLESNKRVLALSREHKSIKPALGLYPIEASNVTIKPDVVDDYIIECDATVDETLNFIREHRDEIVAIGEVGIDLKESDDEANQVENFKKLIALAKEIKKPLIIHSRKAEALVLDLLEESGINKRLVHMHCFSGKKKLVQRGVKLGYSFSIPGSVSRSQQFQQMVEFIPITQLLTETDAPYMPYDLAHERSEPAHVVFTVQKIAEIKGMTEKEVADNLFMNYQRIFG